MGQRKYLGELSIGKGEVTAMEILLFFIGLLLLFFVIVTAINYSNISTYLKNNNILLAEIRDLLKENQTRR